ncbi:MAG: chorismate mutase [Chlamydiales bacterium]
MELAELRKEIDTVNRKILQLLCKLVEIVKKNSLLKSEQALCLEDLMREESQYVEWKRLAEGYRLDPQVIEQMFSLTIAYCKTEMAAER